MSVFDRGFDATVRGYWLGLDSGVPVAVLSYLCYDVNRFTCKTFRARLFCA